MNRITKHLSLFVMAVILLSGGCTPRKEKEVLIISAAASLTDIITEAVTQYKTENPGVEIQVNIGSSSTLARQIEAGAPADLFLSAHPKWSDYLAEKGMTEGEPSILYRNTLIVAAPGDPIPEPVIITPDTNPDSLFGERIALGDPEHVPAGIYAKEALTNLGWYGELEPGILPCADVRAALTAVTLGEADTAVVYRTDVMKGTDLTIKAVFPEELHEPILYTASITKTGAAVKSAQKFLDYLAGPKGMSLAEKFGFRFP